MARAVGGGVERLGGGARTAIEVGPRLDVMMCHSGRRRPAIGRQDRCGA